jgi:hypothetical protein
MILAQHRTLPAPAWGNKPRPNTSMSAYVSVDYITHSFNLECLGAHILYR